LLWAAGIFLLTFTISLAVCGALIVALPPRYFVDDYKLWSGRHPLVRLLGIVGKNLAGVLLIGLGVLLSVPGIPGQGILTIAIGVVLLDIPGKHRLVRAVVRRKGVLRSINRFRAWFGRSPLVVD
jgi:hypothetical protein